MVGLFLPLLFPKNLGVLAQDNWEWLLPAVVLGNLFQPHGFWDSGNVSQELLSPRMGPGDMDWAQTLPPKSWDLSLSHRSGGHSTEFLELS